MYGRVLRVFQSETGILGGFVGSLVCSGPCLVALFNRCLCVPSELQPEHPSAIHLPFQLSAGRGIFIQSYLIVIIQFSLFYNYDYVN